MEIKCVFFYKSHLIFGCSEPNYAVVLLDFSLTVKAAPHKCEIRTSQP